MNLRAVLFAVVSMMLFIAPNLFYLISPRQRRGPNVVAIVIMSGIRETMTKLKFKKAKKV